MRYVLALVVCLVLAGAFVWAVGKAGPSQARTARPAPGMLHVVVSTPIAADFARNVAGEHAFISVVCPLGQDPHQYEPTGQDAALVSEADVVVMIGRGLDDWMLKLTQSARSNAPVVVLTQSLSTQDDPHFWQDPSLVPKACHLIADALGQAKPGLRESYHAQADAYACELGVLDTWVKAQVQTLPEPRRKLFTTHNAMGYYARRYGFEVLPGLQGLSTSEDTEPGTRKVSEVIEQIKSSGVPAIFAESLDDHDHDHDHADDDHGHGHVSNRLLARVARDANVRLVTGLRTDTLGPAGSSAQTYVGMIRSNTELIVKNLK